MPSAKTKWAAPIPAGEETLLNGLLYSIFHIYPLLIRLSKNAPICMISLSPWGRRKISSIFDTDMACFRSFSLIAIHNAQPINSRAHHVVDPRTPQELIMQPCHTFTWFEIQLYTINYGSVKRGGEDMITFDLVMFGCGAWRILLLHSCIYCFDTLLECAMLDTINVDGWHEYVLSLRYAMNDRGVCEWTGFFWCRDETCVCLTHCCSCALSSCFVCLFLRLFYSGYKPPAAQESGWLVSCGVCACLSRFVGWRSIQP